MRQTWVIAAVFSVVFACFRPALAGDAPAAAVPELRWYRGNTHTHTWWSDGDSPPETVVQWYKEHGYHFLVLSDHNVMAEGEKWVTVEKSKREGAARQYEQQFGADWIEKREHEGKTEYRLKTLPEFRCLFEEAGRFLLIPGEEISDDFEKKPIHVNGINLRETVPPQKGATFFETVQNNINAVLEQQEKTKQPMFPHVNHPNFGWAFTAEDMIPLKGEQFFEVYNGHPGVNNAGNQRSPSTEQLWDIILTKRLAEMGLPVMYGLATDDAHSFAGKGSNPGRGWVMVQARRLTPSTIVRAMQAGHFYPSTGVTLKEIRPDAGALEVQVQAEPGVTYRTQFIGTLKNYDPKATSQSAKPGERLSMKYSDTIGRVLSEVEGTRARYKLTGDEIYVRAKVISSRRHPNPGVEGEFEVAWTQPLVPGDAK